MSDFLTDTLTAGTPLQWLFFNLLIRNVQPGCVTSSASLLIKDADGWKREKKPKKGAASADSALVGWKWAKQAAL